MQNLIYRAEETVPPNKGFFGATILSTMSVFIILYIAVILPLIPDDGTGRMENILLWPLLAVLIFVIVLRNSSLLDYKFFFSLPIMSLIAYFAFAAASITWAYAPDFALSRVVVQFLAFTVVVVPFALPISSKYLILGVHLCLAIAFGLAAVYVLTTPPTPIGHTGYFSHKQELGCIVAIGIIIASYELLQKTWRSVLGIIMICLGAWLITESQSKSALAYSLFALGGSFLILLLCKILLLTPAYIVGAITVAFSLVSNPTQRIGWWLYGDPTLTGRTDIWAFINYQISLKPWWGWGFHSYFFVPNSPMRQAGGFVAEMPSAHSGYLTLQLETGQIGYWIFLVFIYSSLHVLEKVRRVDPVRAWCYLSVELFAILLNITDCYWLELYPLWLLYLLVVADSVRYSRGLPNLR
jgi:exopolysaccharide production protein ExoQ